MKTKTTIISMLLLAASVCAVAQEKYEFACVAYSSVGHRMFISINGKEFKVEKVDMPKSEFYFDNATPLLNKINELQDRGWEVMNINVVPVAGEGSTHYAYLKKKKA